MLGRAKKKQKLLPYSMIIEVKAPSLIKKGSIAPVKNKYTINAYSKADAIARVHKLMSENGISKKTYKIIAVSKKNKERR